ncbi:MAG: matrixin family metalloprotease [Planctomycetes bacterium]|nr:matrixin family metalloprotease [Planctomycetota bacterium]
MRGRTPFAFGAILLAAAGAAAYQFVDAGGKPQRWPGGRATVWVDGTMLPDRAAAVRNATQTWSSVPGSAFRFVYGGPSPSANVQDHGNGNSDLYFDPSLPPFGYAVTFAFESGADIVERDVAFNGSIAWGTSGSGPHPDVETVALHELGHVLGLLHEDAVPAVMNSGGDPSVVRRALLDDDRAGVVFLYPAGGGGGGGGGGPKGPDLAAGPLQVTLGTPGAGAAVNLRAKVRNLSALPAGPFRVAAVLVASLPAKAGDGEVGAVEVPSLAGKAETTLDIDVFIPLSTPPGSWRLGVFVDPADALLDPVRDNNGAAAAPFTVSLPPVDLDLGDVLDGGLGPLGVEGGECFVGAGTEVRLKAKGVRGVRPTLRVLDGPGGEVLASAAGRGSARLSWTAPGDGTYLLEVRNAAETVGRFRLSTAGRVRWRGVAAEAPALLPFAACAGGVVKASAVFEGEAAPLLCRPPSGPDLSSPGSARGRRARLGPLVPSETGVHSLVLGGEGPVRVTLDARSPREGRLVVR